MFWVPTSTMEYVQLALAQPPHLRLAALKAALRRYHDDRLVGLQPLARYVQKPVLKRGFVVVERTITALDDLAAATASQPRRDLRRGSK
jgi:hypothetical protein